MTKPSPTGDFSEESNPSALDQNSLSVLEAQTRPIRIVTVNAESPLPVLELDDHYSSAWVFLCRGGVPRRVVTIDLTAGASSIRDGLQKSLTELEMLEPSILDQPNLPDDDLPRISIVIPTVVARTEDLGLCLDAIEHLDYPDFEVVLVDNRPTLPTSDPLLEIVRDRPRLRVVREPVPGAAAARNAGAAVADGEIIAFTDDDVRVERQWLRAIGTRMTLSPQLDALTGLILPAELESPAQIWFERYFGGMGSERTFSSLTLEADPTCSRRLRGSRILVNDSKGKILRKISVYGVGAYGAGANFAIRRVALERVGGFDIRLGIGTPVYGGEDLAIMIDILWAGGQIGYEPAAFVQHRHRREYAELLKQIDGYGIGFTAMLTSLVQKDPRHLLSIASQMPLAIKQLAKQGTQKIRGKPVSHATASASKRLYPPRLYHRELWAFARGPFIYAASRLNRPVGPWHRIIYGAGRRHERCRSTD